MATKQEIKKVSDKIRDAVKAALKDTGYELIKSNATYGEADLNMTLRMFKGDGESKGAIDWKRYATLHQLPENALGTAISFGNRYATIIGFKPTSPKFNIILEDRTTGETFFCTISGMNKALARSRS